MKGLPSCLFRLFIAQNGFSQSPASSHALQLQLDFLGAGILGASLCNIERSLLS